MRRIWAVLAIARLVAAVAVARWSVGAESTSGADRDVCQPTPGVVPKVGGPLHEPEQHVFERVLNYRPPSVIRDIGVIQPINRSDEDVILDRVQLEPEPGVAPLDFKGAFLAPDVSQSMDLAPAGHYPADLVKVACNRLSPTPEPASAPVLVLRVASGSTTEASQYRSVDVIYHTLDGTPWVAVYLVQLRYAAPDE